MKKFISLILLSMGIICLCHCSTEKNETTSYTISLTDKIINCKVDEMTEAKLLANANVVGSDGSSAKAVLDKGNANFSKAGEYDIIYSYNQEQISAKLRVFAMPSLCYKGAEITDDSITLNYGEAKRSYNFTSGISVVDSFGSILDFTKSSDSDDFDYSNENFDVTYIATDTAGNTLTKTITYILSTTDNPVIESKTFNMQNDLDVSLDIDLKNETDFVLYNGSEIVPTENYKLVNNKLVISKKYISTLSIGENKLRVETLNGNGKFSLVIEDNGYPYFTVQSEDAILLEEANSLSVDLPTIVIPGHSYNWQYNLIDRDNEENICYALNRNNSIELTDAEGNSIKEGRYYLDIEATNAKGSFERRMDIRVFSSKIWSCSSGAIVEYGVYDDKSVIRAVSTSTDSKKSILSIPQSDIEGVAKISFDILVKEYAYINANDLSKTSPHLVFWQGDADFSKKTPDWLNISNRLTPRQDSGFAGFEKIIDLSTSEEVSWNNNWETNKWYRITLALKDIDGDLYQIAVNGSSGSYEILYKNFNFEKVDLVFDDGDNITVSTTINENEDSIIVKTTASSLTAAKTYAKISADKLEGVKTIIFDVKIGYVKKYNEEAIPAPKIIYWQGDYDLTKEVPDNLNTANRLTPRGAYAGQEKIIDLTTNQEVTWDSNWETDRWYRIILTLKNDEMDLYQTVNNNTACSYEIMYRNITFEGDVSSTIEQVEMYGDDIYNI